jgi:glycosyltransferase involved in cell wall biosynthesis
MNVLIVHPQMEIYGGAETVIVHLARYLASKDVETRILTLCTADHPDYRGLDIVTPKEAIGYRIRGTRLSDSLEVLTLASSLRRLVKEYVAEYHLVNAHNFPATWASGIVKPVVWQANEFPDLWHNRDPSLPLRALITLGREFDYYMVNRNVDEAVVPDESQARKFEVRYAWLPTVIPYGIEYDLFAQGDGKRSADLYGLDDCFVVLHTGMISPSKNQLASVQAVEKLRGRIPNIRLVLAGLCDGNDYEQTLQRYIHERGLDRYVIFSGHIPKEALADLYHACDVAVYPVRGQGSWLSPFETLCAAKPVVVSSSLSSSKVIAEKGVGTVTDNFVKGILDVYENVEIHREKALRGKCFVAENLTWERYAERMLALFYSVLGI